MAIIAISGKIGSGKDTIGKIIQYLTVKNLDKVSFEEFVNREIFLHTRIWPMPYFNTWKIKKFGGKLKEIISILTGISVEDLEKQEIKDGVLGNEWCRIITTLPLSTDVNKIIKDRNYTNAFFEQTDKTFIVYQKITVRWLLQNIGTNAMRNIIHPNIWVNALFNDYKEHISHDFIPPQNEGYPNWIITDLRFPNELKAVEDRGGITIRVNREPLWEKELRNKLNKELTESFYEIGNSDLKACTGKEGKIDFEIALRKKITKEHESETALDNANFKYTIDNNGTIEELVEKVKEILIKENIL